MKKKSTDVKFFLINEDDEKENDQKELKCFPCSWLTAGEAVCACMVILFSDAIAYSSVK